MLFLPWRNEENELLNIDPIVESQKHIDLVMENSQPFYANRDIDENVLSNMMDGLEDEDDTEDIEHDLFQNEEEEREDIEYIEQGLFHGQGPDGTDVPKKSRVESFLPPRQITDPKYREIMRSLNEKQRRFVLNALHVLKTSSSPFHSLLHGGAGVGKSHVITAIVQSALRFFGSLPTTNPEEICVIVAAPTGKAAFNVFGMTLHCAFRLPPTQSRGALCKLDDGTINSIRLKMSAVKLIIIDEVSMVSSVQLYDIDQRLRQIFATEEDFGGLSVLFCGHFRQLPPIAAPYIFLPPKHLPLGEIVGNHLWAKFQLYELTEIMRQRGALAFCKALNNMSEGCMDEEDIAVMKARQITEDNVPPDQAVWLFKINAQCAVHNKKVHVTLQTKGAPSTAIDKVQGKMHEQNFKFI
jgi:hypothetical protein